MADIKIRNHVIPNPRWESMHDSRPLTGIIKWSLNFSGFFYGRNPISPEHKSDPYYMGCAHMGTRENEFLSLDSQLLCNSLHDSRPLTGIDKLFPSTDGNLKVIPFPRSMGTRM